jgi:L-aspartate oxidase
VLSPESREALWRNAGIERDGEGLQALTGDPHPLVRLIARSGLARAESRGAHQRRDFPETDPQFENCHVILERDSEPVSAHWA